MQQIVYTKQVFPQYCSANCVINNIIISIKDKINIIALK